MVEISRYAVKWSVATARDPFEDLTTFLDFLTAHDYTIEVLTSRHGLTTADARARAKRIEPHVRIAAGFIDQAMSGPTHLSFLPSYYAILNLAKAYILFSPQHGELAHHSRWHGVSYAVGKKDSHNLLTEEVVLNTGGALALFYRVLTGDSIISKRTVRLADMYSVLQDVTFEFDMASGRKPNLTGLSFDLETLEGGRVRPRVSVSEIADAPLPTSVRQMKVLRGFGADPLEADVYVGKSVVADDDDVMMIRRQLRCFLLYQPYVGSELVIATPVSGSTLLLPEEFPIALVFFHLSSVVRYKPEWFARLRDSRFWPLIRSTHNNCLQKFVSLFWSYVQQEEIRFTRK